MKNINPFHVHVSGSMKIDEGWRLFVKILIREKSMKIK